MMKTLKNAHFTGEITGVLKVWMRETAWKKWRLLF
jgi:hypothetical protein